MSQLKFNIPFTFSIPGNATWTAVTSIRAPADQHALIEGLDIHGDGVNGSAKVMSLRLRRVNPGTGTGTTLSAAISNPGLQAYAIARRSVVKHSFSALPAAAGLTNGDEIFRAAFHPQGGRLWDWGFRRDKDIPAGTELALECMVESGESAVVVTGTLSGDE